MSRPSELGWEQVRAEEAGTADHLADPPVAHVLACPNGCRHAPAFLGKPPAKAHERRCYRCNAVLEHYVVELTEDRCA